MLRVLRKIKIYQVPQFRESKKIKGKAQKKKGNWKGKGRGGEGRGEKKVLSQADLHWQS